MQSLQQLQEAVPMLHKVVLDIPSNTRVRVLTTNEVVVEGYVTENPKETAKTDWLEMANCKYIHPKSYGSRRIIQYHIEEMLDITIVSSSKILTQQKALVMETFVVTQELQLLKVMDSLESTNVVGLAFHGNQVGRHGKVGIISLNCKDNLVIIDIQCFAANNASAKIWAILKKRFFENQNIKKVVHSILPIADYLNHQHDIKIKNVFDLQMAEVYITYEHTPNDNSGTENLSIALDDLLTKYLSHLVIKEEIELYKEFRTNLRDERFFARPFIIDETAKGIAISVKYLLRLQKIFSQKFMEHYNRCVEVQMSTMIEGDLLEMINFVGMPELLFRKTAELVAQKPWSVGNT